LGERLVQVALRTLKEVDAIMFLVEAGQPPGPGDSFIIRQFEGLTTPVLLVINKVDLVRREELLPLIDQYRKMYNFSEIIPVSALTGENLSHLVETVIEYLPAGPEYFPEGMLTDRPEVFIMAELIREKILNLTEQEVPHSAAVVIEGLEDRPNNVVAIRAMIYTEKDTQKAILIGKGGHMLKKIGQLAREEMESLLGSKIFLELWVKVRPGWRNKESQLKNLGYREED
ncbi:MAG: GTPase Era, partial [Desulfotomaculaceae bacterium]|nr:GTPase Era [Desulfotomaculaceae bacterium]